ncbi:hypothetical protein [Altericista sp. CCNU0014]|uniref:hypothetical protein n=1 Tax=Altericista sp. CCNU0014 TaxID=3082949 RepID=UPI00384B0019
MTGNEYGVLMRAADAMLDRLQTLARRENILTQGVPTPQAPVFELLRNSIETYQELVSAQLLSISPKLDYKLSPIFPISPPPLLA